MYIDWHCCNTEKFFFEIFLFSFSAKFLNYKFLYNADREKKSFRKKNYKNKNPTVQIIFLLYKKISHSLKVEKKDSFG